MTLGESMKYNRKLQGITQVELAKAMNYVDQYGTVDCSMISCYEHDKRQPTWYTLNRIAKVIGPKFILDALDEDARDKFECNAPVRHGEWLFDADTDGWRCSVCGHITEETIGDVLEEHGRCVYVDYSPFFCSKCGTKMDGAER